MNRFLLVTLCLLLVAVGFLFTSYLDVRSQLDEIRGRSDRGSNHAGLQDEELRTRFHDFQQEMMAQWARLENRVGESVPVENVDEAKPEDKTTEPDRFAHKPEEQPRPRDADGNFVFSEQELERAAALRRAVDTRRRVQGMTRIAMRRIDRLAEQGEIQALDEKRRAQVEDVLAKYSKSSTTMMQRLFRNPDSNVSSMKPEERRELIQTERATLQTAALADLTVILGQADAEKINESVLSRNTGRRVDRGTRRRGGRGGGDRSR